MRIQAKNRKARFSRVGENPKNHSLWIIPAEADSQRKRTPRHFDTPGHVTDFDWSPDSRTIACAHMPTPKANDFTQADISEVDRGDRRCSPDRGDRRRGT